MKTIERDTIGEAHEEIIKQIILEGIEQPTKHGDTLEFPEAIAVKILLPFNNPIKSECYKFPLEGMKLYAKQLLNFSKSQFDYNCGNRWFDYFDYKENAVGDGDGEGFNQIQFMVINELKKDNTSRRAIVTSYYPTVDVYLDHIPCISQLQFLIRNCQLNMEVYIRSNDMLSAFGSDAYALSQVLLYVSQALDITPGYLEMISVSAHIYYKRDASELLKFRRKLNV